MNIEERIKEVGLRPSDIVKLQVLADGKPIGLSQATGWIKNPTATKAIEQLLWRLCDEKVESGLTFSKPGRKKEPVVAEIFSEPRLTLIERAKPYVDAAVDASIRLKIAMDSQKIPAKEPSPLPSAVPTGFPSWGTDKTMKVAGRVVKFNLNGLSYSIDPEEAKSGFLVDGKEYRLSDFTEVK